MDVRKIQNAIQWMKNGGLVIVADDEDRESEGDMIGLGSKVTPENYDQTYSWLTLHPCKQNNCPTFKFLPNGTK